MPMGLGIGAAAGLIKYQLDKQTAEKQQALQAAIAKYSPWTGMKAQPVTPVNPVSDALPFAATGASMAQDMKLNNSLAKRLDAGLTTGSDTGSIVGGGVGKAVEAANMPSSVTLGAGNYGSSPTTPPVSLSPQSAQYLSKQNPNFPGLTLQSSWWNMPITTSSDGN